MNAFRAGLVLLGGSGVGFVLRLARNIVVARLISVEDYGIASTFLVAVSFIDMTLNLSLGKFAVQHRAGEDADFIAALKGITVARGILIFALLLVAAGPIADLFGQPELVWAYQLIAVIPLVLSFQHPDLQRLQRSMRFESLMLNRIGTLGLTLLLVWPLALIFGDFRVMLAIYIIETLTRLALSFVIAERPYRIGWNTRVAIEAFRFSWPLTLGGLIIFVALQGDRIIISNQFGATMLGLFSAAMTLTMPPTMHAGALIRTFFLPLLARVQDDDAAFTHRSVFTLQATLATTALAVLGFALIGPPVFNLTFGPRYAEGATLVGLLGIVFGLQLFRAGTATVAMARGHTLNMLVSNLVRLAFLPGALFVAVTGGTVTEMVAVGALGQFAGVVVSLVMLYYRSNLGGFRQMRLPFAFGTLLLAAVTWGLWNASGEILAPLPAVACLAAFLCLIASCRIMLRELRQRIVERR